MESFKDYVVMPMEEAQELRVKSTLNHVEEMLPDNQFLKNRSHLFHMTRD